MPEVHAILGPSSAKRWMACAPSARAEQSVPEASSPYALEGTIAHACAEWMLNYYKRTGGLMEFSDLQRELVKGETPHELRDLARQCDQNGFDFMDIMETVHDYYVVPVYEDFIEYRKADKGAQLLVEVMLNLESFIPEGFGTSDAVIIAGGFLHVYDLKYGQGVKVDAEDNPQMMCYALGALYGPAEDYLIDTVRMTILQPRLKHHSEAEMTFGELLGWGKYTLRPAAQKAFKGEGEYVPGDHCKFCKVAPRCRACAMRATILSEADSQPELLTDEELSDLLGKIDSIENWAGKVRAYALDRTLRGDAIPGWKAVEGRSTRKISDQKAALNALIDAGFSSEDVLKPSELKSLTDLEKLLRKGAFNDILGPFITRAQGKPALAPESDKRPAYVSNVMDDFRS